MRLCYSSGVCITVLLPAHFSGGSSLGSREMVHCLLHLAAHCCHLQTVVHCLETTTILLSTSSRLVMSTAASPPPPDAIFTCSLVPTEQVVKCTERAHSQPQLQAPVLRLLCTLLDNSAGQFELAAVRLLPHCVESQVQQYRVHHMFSSSPYSAATTACATQTA